MEICVGILLLMIFGPLVFKLLGAILRGLGPVIAVIVAAAIVLGIGALVLQIVSSLISGAVNVIFGPLGLLLLGGAVAYLGYREWNKRQITRSERATYRAGSAYAWPEKPKRSEPRLDIGDDGEIVTLDELLDEDEPEKKKRS